MERRRLIGGGAVVDLEEFEGLEDGFLFAGGAAALFSFGDDGGSLNDMERIAVGLFECFRGNRTVREFETTLRAPQHPSGHVSACPGLSSDDSAGEKDASAIAENGNRKLEIGKEKLESGKSR